MKDFGSVIGLTFFIYHSQFKCGNPISIKQSVKLRSKYGQKCYREDGIYIYTYKYDMLIDHLHSRV